MPAASGEVLAALNGWIYTVSPEDVEVQGEEVLCTICLHSAGVGSEMIKLPCSHLFNAECIREWLSRSDFCPNCNQKVTLGGAMHERPTLLSFGGDGFSPLNIGLQVFYTGIQVLTATAQMVDAVLTPSAAFMRNAAARVRGPAEGNNAQQEADRPLVDMREQVQLTQRTTVFIPPNLEAMPPLSKQECEDLKYVTDEVIVAIINYVKVFPEFYDSLRSLRVSWLQRFDLESPDICRLAAGAFGTYQIGVGASLDTEALVKKFTWIVRNLEVEHYIPVSQIPVKIRSCSILWWVLMTAYLIYALCFLPLLAGCLIIDIVLCPIYPCVSLVAEIYVAAIVSIFSCTDVSDNVEPDCMHLCIDSQLLCTIALLSNGNYPERVVKRWILRNNLDDNRIQHIERIARIAVRNYMTMELRQGPAEVQNML